MKGLRWFQTKVGLFQDPRMMYLLNQPHGDSYFVIWFYLKDLAGMINDDGYIYVSERQVMPTELLARQLRRRKAFVERVLDVFEQIDLISRDETGLIRIVPWDEIQSFSRDEKKRSDARDRMRRYRQRQREGLAKAAVCASHNEMTGRMPDERLQGVNGQACKTGYTAPYGRAELDCVQNNEQVSAILDEKIQNINEPLPKMEYTASYGETTMGCFQHGEKDILVTDKKRLRVNGQTHQTGYTAPYGKAELDCVQHNERIEAMLDEKIQNINEPLPETEYTASYGGTAVDYPRNGMKTVAVTDKKRLRAHGQAQQTGYTVPYGKAALDFVQHNEQVGAILDEKMQNINEPIPETEYAASCGGADLNCTQLSERQEIAAYDRDGMNGIQGEEGDEGIAYVTEADEYTPYAGSAADRFDEGRDTCGDREEPSSLPGGKALLYYEALFGKADGQTVEALQGLARRWGDEAVCRAICIALKKGASSVQYIHAVLVHSKGSPRHDTAPSPYETERSMPSGQGGLRHISDMSWGSPDVSLGEGICPVYEAMP
ncbi:phage replisome organizer N-terminal domain-containing protein [uncultured Megasphaera sp.]|uniref:phage replisome organizer N-terminal domain-containing protein n=1 Tax=uncultured Megasphaera sp. TaxID=165188 RepID=UPI002639FA83|nr:phage replisome organizer N-terminal domain-containing protein [uncultured Megasphaera sp.]